MTTDRWSRFAPLTGALIGFVLWSIVVSVLIYVRLGAPADAGVPASQPAV
jgi:hypothetical protein